MKKYLLLTEEEVREYMNFPGFHNNVQKVSNFKKMYNNVYFVSESWLNEKENLEMQVGNSYLLNDNEIIAVIDKVSDTDFKVLDFSSLDNSISTEILSVVEFNSFVTKKLDKEFFDRVKLLNDQYSIYLDNANKILADANII